MLRARRRSFVIIGGIDEPRESDPTPGGHLREAGLDVGPGRTAHADARLIRWLQLFGNDPCALSPLGQLVVSWRDEPAGVAQLEHLECEPLASHAAVEELVLVGSTLQRMPGHAGSSTGLTTWTISTSAFGGSPRAM